MKIINKFILLMLLFISNVSFSATIIKVSYPNQKGEPLDLAMEFWAKDIESRSNGKIKLELYPSSQLGSQTEVLEQAMFGANVITVGSYGYLMDTVPDIGVIDAPYLTQSFEKKSKLLQSDWFKEQSEKLEKAGIKIVVPDLVYGTRHIMANKPVSKPEDLEGMKIRVQHSRLFYETIKAMGGVPTPMSLSEVYSSMSQGVVDGLENPAVVLLGGKFYEVSKYLSMTAHTKHMAPFVTGTAFWNKLTNEEKNIIVLSSRDMVAMNADLIKQTETEAIDKLREQGVKINEDVELDIFKQDVSKAMDNAFKEWTPGLYSDIQNLLEEL